MKKSFYKAFLGIGLFGLVLTGCSSNPVDPHAGDQKYEIYELYRSSGGDMSYEEWLESIRGDDGLSLLTGTENPTSSIGKDGDTYINISSWDFFVKEGGVWNKKGNIMGEPGQDLTDDNPQGLAFYPLDDGTYGVGAGTSYYLSKIVIPDSYKGIPVTTIVTGGFRRFVIDMGDYSTGISNLEEIILPNTITRIESYAFTSQTKLKSVSLSSSLDYIGNDAFNGCFALEYSEYQNGLYLGNEENNYSALIGLSDLYAISFSIKEGCEIVSASAFKECNYLETIDAPASVRSINSQFSDCSSLRAVNVDSDNAVYASINGIIFDKSLETVIFCPHAYAGEIEIPNSVSAINSGAFYQCSGITSITLSTAISSIGDYSFYGCSSLVSIVIPDSVTSIGSYAFYNCSSLTNVFYAGTKTQWNNIEIGNNNDFLTNANVELNSEVNKLIEVVADKYSYVLTNDNRVLGFKIIDKTITSFDFEEELPGLTIVSLDNNAFYNCSSLTSVVIPDSVTSIGSYAFYNCSSLTSINIPGSVTLIGDCTFANCTSLTSIVIPASVTSIGGCAFYDCSSLTNVFYAGTKAQWNNIEIEYDNYCLINANVEFNIEVNKLIEVVTDKYSYTLINDNKVFDFKILDETITSFDFEKELPGLTIVSLGKNAFRNCFSLTSVVIPDSVTSIGSYAFYNCFSLTSVVIPDSVTSIGSYAFRDCTSLTIYCEAQSKPDGWNSKWNYSNRPVVWGYVI